MTKDKKTDSNFPHSASHDDHKHLKNVNELNKKDPIHHHEDHHGHDHHHHHDHGHDHGHDHSHDHNHNHSHGHSHDHKHEVIEAKPLTKELTGAEKQARKGKNKRVANVSKAGEKKAFATLKLLRTSPRKLDLVAALIRNQNVADALTQLNFSRKRIAKPVKELLKSVIANAENNHNLNIDNLVISKVIVGKGLVMKRIHTRARGRAFKIRKPFSNITIEVTELQATARRAV
jgi:large subunit ribosomal protein L22